MHAANPNPRTIRYLLRQFIQTYDSGHANVDTSEPAAYWNSPRSETQYSSKANFGSSSNRLIGRDKKCECVNRTVIRFYGREGVTTGRIFDRDSLQ